MDHWYEANGVGDGKIHVAFPNEVCERLVAMRDAHSDDLNREDVRGLTDVRF